MAARLQEVEEAKEGRRRGQGVERAFTVKGVIERTGTVVLPTCLPITPWFSHLYPSNADTRAPHTYPHPLADNNVVPWYAPARTHNTRKQRSPLIYRAQLTYGRRRD